MPLIEHTKKGLYCPIAKVYIDPWGKVDNALITHGHSDHARWGHKYYVCADTSVNILKHRLGQQINIRGMAFGESLTVNGVKFSFHPAGHITGSAQIRAEHNGEVWVATGDYKIEDDGLCQPFEPIKCDHFITECTFGLPIYSWPDQASVFQEIEQWWAHNASNQITSIISAYSLGKAQRIINTISQNIGPIICHQVIEKMNAVYRESGFNLPETVLLKDNLDKDILSKGLVIAPPGALKGNWVNKIKKQSLGIASGWMAVRGNRRRRGADRGFVLSDHCDWEGLNQAIKATGAENIYPTHGNTVTFSRWLNDQGYNARPIETEFGGAADDDGIELVEPTKK